MSNNESRERLAEDLAGVARESSNLIGEEAKRAREEVSEKAITAGIPTAMVVGGGVLVAYGGVFLIQSGVRLLASRMPLWSASLLVGGTLTAGGTLLAVLGGMNLKNQDLLPERTINDLRAEGEAILRQVRSVLG